MMTFDMMTLGYIILIYSKTKKEEKRWSSQNRVLDGVTICPATRNENKNLRRIRRNNLISKLTSKIGNEFSLNEKQQLSFSFHLPDSHIARKKGVSSSSLR